VSDEIAEIIPRPPSSPIGSTLLIVSTLGMILAIAIVWNELFVEYLPAGPLDPEMSKHVVRTEAERHTRDHYAEDFPGGGETLASVEADLQINANVGDLSAGAGGGGGGGDASQPESPDGQ
jgi:hypothetical protein